MAGRDLDLHLAKGELVAVLGEADTRGDRRRWLVDAGGAREPMASVLILPTLCFNAFPAVAFWRLGGGRLALLKLTSGFASGLQAEEATRRPQS